MESTRRIRFMPAPPPGPAAAELVDVFRTILTNGGAHLAALTVEDVDDAAHWYLMRNRFEEYGFIRCLLASPGLAAALPEVAGAGVTAGGRPRGREFLVPDVVAGEVVGPSFLWRSPLMLDGDLGASLRWGGAHGRFPGRGVEAKRLGAAFVDAVFGDRYDDVRVEVSSAAWSPWFYDGSWSRTWVVTDDREARVTILCVTDID